MTTLVAWHSPPNLANLRQKSVYKKRETRFGKQSDTYFQKFHSKRSTATNKHALHLENIYAPPTRVYTYTTACL